MTDDPLKSVRQQVEACRRLADRTHDASVAERLRRLADELEEKAKKLAAKPSVRG